MDPEESGRDDPDHATRALFRGIALERQGYYDAVRGGRPRLSVWQRRLRRMTERALDARVAAAPRPRRLLDAACGRGDFTLRLAARYPDLEQVLGCDFCPEILDLARVPDEQASRVRFAEGDLTRLPFAAAHVDLTLCLNALHHVRRERLADALDELARVTARALLIEIKNARSLYFRAHSGRVEGVPVFPASVAEVAERLAGAGFALAARRPIFGIETLSPIVLLEFERRSAVQQALRSQGLAPQQPA